MTKSSKADGGLLVVTTYNDRPETEIYRALVREGVAVHMICAPDAPEHDALAESGVTVVPFDLDHSTRDEAIRLIGDCARTCRVASVYALRTTALSLASSALRTTSTRLVGYRGTTGHMGFFDFGPRRTYKDPRVDMIVCVSNAVREYLAGKGIAEDKLVTIPKGHNVDWYSADSRESLSALGIPEKAFVIGFAGSVRRVKGVIHLIRALDHLPRDLNVHVLIAGDVSDRLVRSTITRAPYRNLVHCAGFRKDASSIMGACNAFAMPSLKREGMPRAPIEAMAQGVPPLASSAGGIPEIVEDGRSGLLFPPGDPAAIARAITRLARNPGEARTLGHIARQRIKTSFNVETSVQRMKLLFAAASGR